MLYTRCILAPRELPHEYRLSVMSRHTLTDGISPDPLITRDLWDDHDLLLAPPLRLIGSYYRKEINWRDFEEGYQDHLETFEVRREVARIAELALERPVILLCIEKEPHQCHRRLLAEACRDHIPQLTIKLR